MTTPRYPSLYQINTRVWLTELSRDAGPAGDAGRHSRRRTGPPGRDGLRLGLVSERLADRPGGAAGLAQQSRSGARSFRRRCPTCARRTFPVPVSPSPATRCISSLGGDAALARLRERLRKRGLRLLLDFVPNHTGLDHPWVEDHPEYYIPGTELDLARAPQNYTWVKRKQGDLLLAHGRDPYFPGLAGHPAAQLRQPGHAGGDDRGAA